MLQNNLKKDYLFGGRGVNQPVRGHPFGDLGLSWGPDGGPDSQNSQNDLQNDPRDIQISQKTTHTTIIGWEAQWRGKQN